MKTELLSEVQNFLRSRNFLAENKISFYAYWASRFIDFSNKQEEIPSELRPKAFIEYLRKSETADWQIMQAEEAVGLYIKEYLDSGSRKDCFLIYPKYLCRRVRLFG